MIVKRDIDEYKQEMIEWIVSHTDKTYKEIQIMFDNDKQRLDLLFEPYPETVMHCDPVKWAEMLSVLWKLIEEPELEFFEDN